MNVPNAWMDFFCLLLVVGELEANIDAKENFCGKKLTTTLNELCAIYNNPTFGRNRFRRQIVDECCRAQCSRRYLVRYYCQEVNSSILPLLNAPVIIKTAHEKDSSIQEKRKDVSNNSPVGTRKVASTDQLISNHNKKRKCKCRTRRAKKKNIINKMPQLRNLIQVNPVPRANIGHVEQSQRPFYIWRYQRVV